MNLSVKYKDNTVEDFYEVSDFMFKNNHLHFMEGSYDYSIHIHDIENFILIEL